MEKKRCVDCKKESHLDVQETFTDKKLRCSKCRGEKFDTILKEYEERLKQRKLSMGLY